MYIYQAKSSRFESTDFASVVIDDVGDLCPYVSVHIPFNPASYFITMRAGGTLSRVHQSLLTNSHKTYTVAYIVTPPTFITQKTAFVT